MKPEGQGARMGNRDWMILIDGFHNPIRRHSALSYLSGSAMPWFA
jgi:hypothetical protein